MDANEKLSVYIYIGLLDVRQHAHTVYIDDTIAGRYAYTVISICD